MQLPTYDDVLDLWECARVPKATPTLAHLLRDSVPPDDRDDYGETALHVAAAHGNDEAVIILLQYGANLMAADWESGWTPLHRSLYHQHLSTSLLLLRHAQLHFGRNFMRKYLRETKDHSQQSPMQLLTSRLQRKRKHFSDTVNAHDGGLVYTFGKQDYQLGYHLLNADMQVTPRLVELPANSPIIQLSANKYHTIALNALGECFVWGFGKGGRLGTGNEFDRIEPTRLASLETTPIKRVAAGENHTMALSRVGQVFSWGSNSFGQLGHTGKSSSLHSCFTPKRIDALRFHVIAEIAASKCHSAAIDASDGAVYTWGSNRRGQLGRKEGYGTDQADATPRGVDALCLRHSMCVVYGNYDSVRAEKVALSDWQTCVILRCAYNGHSLGQVWQFGYDIYRPSRVKISSAVATKKAGAVMCDTWEPTCKQGGIDIVEVSCALNHSIALSACGSVFTWRHNVPPLSHQSSSNSKNHRINLSEDNASSTPSLEAPQCVLLTDFGPVANVCASQDNCAVVTQQGDLVTWDCDQQGILGHERGNTWQSSPKRVAGVKKAVAVTAGHQHTAVLVAPVHPELNAGLENTLCSRGTVPSLMQLVERKISTCVDVSNCASVWQYAERYAAFQLLNYCVEYMRCNWDVLLDAVGRDRMEMLYDVMLPPVQDSKPKINSISGEVISKPGKNTRIAKHLSATKSAINNGSTSLGAATLNENEELLAKATLESASSTSSMVSNKSTKRRKGRHSKFVPLKSFLTNEATLVSKRREAGSPWGFTATTTPSQPEETQSNTVSLPATPAYLEAFPLPVSSFRKVCLDGTISDQREGSIGSHLSASPGLPCSSLPVPKKQMLDYDGADYEQVTAFSLDAFLKKSAVRNNHCKRRAPAATTWSSQITDAIAEMKICSKTLKEIQEEEEASAAYIREAKARLGGTVAHVQRSHSTINSWGLCQPPEHVSLIDIQRLQEEHKFLEQQRHIMSNIEQEQAATARAMAAAAVCDTFQSKMEKSKRGNRRVQKAAKFSTGRKGPATSASRKNEPCERQSKQNKQKKAKERRKAVGGTLAEYRKKDSAQRVGVMFSNDGHLKPLHSHSLR